MTQAELYADPALPDRMKAAVFGLILRDQPAPDDGRTLPDVARQLHAQLSLADTTALATVEQALLLHWLDRLKQ